MSYNFKLKSIASNEWKAGLPIKPRSLHIEHPRVAVSGSSPLPLHCEQRVASIQSITNVGGETGIASTHSCIEQPVMKLRPSRNAPDGVTSLPSLSVIFPKPITHFPYPMGGVKSILEKAKMQSMKSRRPQEFFSRRDFFRDHSVWKSYPIPTPKLGSGCPCGASAEAPGE